MRTTLNLPDELVARAKETARRENTTLTSLIVEGLSARVSQAARSTPLPVSSASGGLIDGVDWTTLEPIDAESEVYR